MRLIDEDDKEISEINMTPFVDIILVVLIIFMATATFIVEGKIPLNLPKAETGEPKEIKVKRIEITILKTGELFINDKKINPDLLEEKLKQLKGKDTVVVLRADQSIEFQKVVSIIDTCRKVGLEKYMIETKRMD
ncbi:MAG TPA: biopolymer transporter ExbD [Persephonella sp.]|uniref:Biopolymer transport protein ExbD n=1 Tax=Persephonella marina (strain DSM 14350 / EX-H1) TaxID=123214 RepID=C0QU46_PERMH|nr:MULTISPECIES: biopolymer transporter ExbD [Persephonella]ACO04428.1 biopolymer transport protein ExbD [Persephonella marina EX-H1]HCB70172.1 biopolymer transporter ExbD [Persephonella sp.]